jgi:hypothetical protein
MGKIGSPVDTADTPKTSYTWRGGNVLVRQELYFRSSYSLNMNVLVLKIQLQWLNPDNNHELLWDYSMCADTSRGAAIRDLIARALKGPLGPGQQEVRCSILLFALYQFKLGRNNCFDKYLGSFNTSISFFLHSLQSFLSAWCWILLWHQGFQHPFLLCMHIYSHIRYFHMVQA